MVASLFGETEAKQRSYLKHRVPFTAVCVLSAVSVALIDGVNTFVILFLAVWLIWGWGAVKKMFGPLSIRDLFSGNFFLGLGILSFLIIVSGGAGLCCAVMGSLRYIQLLPRRA